MWNRTLVGIDEISDDPIQPTFLKFAGKVCQPVSSALV